MSKVILDASALLALLNQEEGHQKVAKHLPDAMMSTVNVSEVATVLVSTGIPVEEVEELIDSLISHIEIFNSKQAYISALLREQTKKQGLSFGDRACLSLAMIKKIPVLTADKIWNKLSIDLDIRVIR
jgi:PIN domain nuclease of toxin-antitoxin system